MSPPQSPAAAPLLMRRSRNGCIDCRRAKVKCDEIRPSCGTCARRRHVCQGYAKPPANSAQHRSSAAAAAAARMSSTRGSPRTGNGTSPGSTPAGSPGAELIRSAVTRRGTSPLRPEYGGAPSPAVSMVGSLSLIPRGAVPPADESNIETYFKRHPFELLMGEEFVSEMNANVLMVLQHDPVIMADALSAIGYAYLAGDSSRSLMLVLNRRARILANLRSLKPSSCYFEQALFLLLVLCAMELVTLAQPGHQATIPTVLSNVSSLIGHHLATGGSISFVGRYLLRALARQDLVISLVQLRKPRVPTYAWLNMSESTKPDRLLGYTATLMPLLEELCALAESVRDQILHLAQPSSSNLDTSSASQNDDLADCLDLWLTSTPSPPTSSDFHIRADSLRHRLATWRPTINDSLPFRSTRKFRAQAASYRAGGLLYLHRLQYPPQPSIKHTSGTSPSYFDTISGAGSMSFGLDSTSALPSPVFQDDFGACPVDPEAEALSMAHDIMMYASGPSPEETKLLLWPVFLAACEMHSEEDREAVKELFAFISTQRGTVTVERTRKFVEDRVWRARDTGEEWNWMVLAHQYPGECMPI